MVRQKKQMFWIFECAVQLCNEWTIGDAENFLFVEDEILKAILENLSFFEASHCVYFVYSIFDLIYIFILCFANFQPHQEATKCQFLKVLIPLLRNLFFQV